MRLDLFLQDDPGILEIEGSEDEIDMFDWLKYRSALMSRITEFSAPLPGAVGGYVLASGAGSKAGHLDEKTR
jgi:hypothetical protein